MNFLPPKVTLVTVCLFAIFSLVSCSKDSDLLADYVITDSQAISKEIRIIALLNEPVIIAPIGTNTNQVITGVSNPTIGTAQVNVDNTITYTPNTNAVGTDNFTYSTTTTNSDATGSAASGSVNITVINSEVKYWKALFDTKFNAGDGAKMLAESKSGNKFQEYYYMYYYFDGLLSIWQATGDNSYLNTMLTVIDNTIKDALPVSFNTSYLGWKADATYDLDYPQNGVALWESYYWKAVTTLLRMMHKSPKLMATGTYQQQYDKILVFTEKNIWDKWQAKGNSYIYRENTHMSSHWARMGMELFIITGKQKYKDVFNNISFGTMPGWPSNLRGQMRLNQNVPGAYVWASQWGGNNVQDTPHASDIVTFCILAYENGWYWTRSDMDALATTLDKVIFLTTDGPDYRLNVDGSGGYDVPGRLRDWVKLGRYKRSLQNRLISQYQSDASNASRYSIQNLANFALNEKILSDGRPVYPENL
jgi:hypothetical protein